MIFQNHYKKLNQELLEKIESLEKENEKLRRQIIELSAEIGKSLIRESRFTPDVLSSSIDATNALLRQKETELNEINSKLADQQSAMGRLDYYYTQFRTWADEFDNSTMEQKKMIACRLIREIKVYRGYRLEIVFDMNYEQFVGGEKIADDPCIIS